MFGDWFGRPHDNWHRPVSVAIEPGRLVVTFGEGEMLTIDVPEGVDACESEFKVQRAKRVRWEWYYYGRPKTPMNRFFLEYVFRDSEVVGTTNVNWYCHAFTVSPDEPAVWMH